MWYEGVLALSPWGTVLATLLLTHITVLSVTIYLHRYSAHNSLELHPVLKHFFRFWLWMTTGMRTKEWTAIHRKHHARCETSDDPHSPVQKGLKTVLWHGAELYRKEAGNPETIESFGQRTPEDWIENNVYTPYPTLGVSIMLLIDITLFGVIGITVWAVQMIWIPFFAAGVINGIGHHSGYRNFECRDAARNIFPWGILIGGEELHNNHHTYPNSAKLSVRPWEFDIGWFWIRLFKYFRLARIKRTQPLAVRNKQKDHIDRDTVMAVINNRFQIMAQYRHHVITPLVQNERKLATEKTKQLLKSAQKLLAREDHLLAPAHMDKIHSIIDSSQVLNTIYMKKKDLQAIWHQIKDQNERIEALIQWCHEAESSGIKVLQDFSRNLRTYTLPAAT